MRRRGYRRGPKGGSKNVLFVWGEVHVAVAPKVEKLLSWYACRIMNELLAVQDGRVLKPEWTGSDPERQDDAKAFRPWTTRHGTIDLRMDPVAVDWTTEKPLRVRERRFRCEVGWEAGLWIEQTMGAAFELRLTLERILALEQLAGGEGEQRRQYRSTWPALRIHGSIERGLHIEAGAGAGAGVDGVDFTCVPDAGALT